MKGLYAGLGAVIADLTADLARFPKFLWYHSGRRFRITPMSICRYCGQKIGWFKDAHDECVQKAQLGIEALKTFVSDAVVQGKKYDEVKDRIGGLGADSSIPKDQV